MTPSQNMNGISGQIKLTNIKQVERTKIIPPMKIEKDGRMLEIGIKYSENTKKGLNENKEYSMRT